MIRRGVQVSDSSCREDSREGKVVEDLAEDIDHGMDGKDN